MFLPMLSAILGIAAFLPFKYFYWTIFVFLVPLFIFFVKEQKFWRLILGVFLFRLTFSLGTVYYTFEPILWTTSLSIFSAIAIAVWLAKLAGKKREVGFCLLFALSFLWTFFDHLQARFSLIPTYIITAGNALGLSPFAGLAAFGGPIALTFFTAAANALIAAAALKLGEKKFRRAAAFAATALIFIILGWQTSEYKLNKNSAYYNNLPNSIKIALISANENFNLSQLKKLKFEIADKQLDLIIFPEDVFDETGDSLKIFSELAGEVKTPVLAAFDTIRNGNRYNSAVLFSQNGEIADVHNKSRLTFAGEYWPFGSWLPPFYKWIAKADTKTSELALFKPQNAYVSGEQNLMETGGIKFAALICLEIQYPADLRNYVAKGARFIANQTSDRWIDAGRNHFVFLTNNLKLIESIWLRAPIVSSGVNDAARITLPNGKMQFIGVGGKNYAILFGEIKR